MSTTWTDLLGETLITKAGEKPTSEWVAGKKIVGLYFSAHWCPPCRGFTPLLSATYDEVVEEHPEFEIIFVSSDRDPEQFDEYYAEMPFAALPYDSRDKKNELAKKFDVRGIPMLVFLDAKGDLLTTDGRMIIAESKGNVDEIWAKLTSAK